MGRLRRHHIGYEVIPKYSLSDNARIKTRTEHVLVKGAGASVTGNPGVAYVDLPASRVQIDFDDYENIITVEFVSCWNPETTAGGLQIYNETDDVVELTVEPGIVGARWDVNDVTSPFATYTGIKRFWVRTRGDGTTAPTLESVKLMITVSTY